MAGELNYRKIVVCHECHGEGEVRVYNDVERYYNYRTCPVCGGKRVLIKNVRVSYEQVEDKDGQGSSE